MAKQIKQIKVYLMDYSKLLRIKGKLDSKFKKIHSIAEAFHVVLGSHKG